ncbi:MAG: helix-turn-helix transcriptional regulator [Bacteroidales bacterium]|nr:helix-turn-helix transcriptional regulator [Bacteroidales bacterium]
MDNKNIFSTNLKKYMALQEKSRNDISRDLGISYYTVTDWVKGKKYPRMDKVEALANYFGILKSDLIEDKSEEHYEMQKNNDIISDAVIRMRSNEDFLSVVKKLMELDDEQVKGVNQMLNAFIK